MLKALLSRHASRHGFLSRQIVTAAQTYLNAYCRVDDYDITTNGERALLRTMRQFAPKTLFDVGANQGDWTAAALEALPNAQIHAFELSPITAERVRTRFASQPRVQVNGFGLSDTDQAVTITHVDADPTLSGLYKDQSQLGGRQLESRVATGAHYLAESNLAEVDIIKIDTEGHDLDVIRGFGAALACCLIVQFEYNELSWARGFFLPAFEAALPGHTLGRLTAGGVIWERGLISNARATAGNIIAVRKDRADLIAALARFA